MRRISTHTHRHILRLYVNLLSISTNAANSLPIMDGDDGFVELRRHGRERELTDTIVAFTVVSRVIMKHGVATLPLQIAG